MAFRGTSVSQNSKFGDKQAKLLKSIKFPSVYSQPVDTAKVNLDVMRDWISSRLAELLGFDDDIVTEMAFEYLDQSNPDPKIMHINLLGFLEDKTSVFMKDLWNKLLSAQQEESGIPREILEEKIRNLKAHVKEERLPSNALPSVPLPGDHPRHAPPPVADIERNVPVRRFESSTHEPLDRGRSPRRFQTTHNTLERGRSRSPPHSRHAASSNQLDRNRDHSPTRRHRSRSRSPVSHRHASASPPPRSSRGHREDSRSRSPVYYRDTRGRSRSPAYYHDTRYRSRSRSPARHRHSRSRSPTGPWGTARLSEDEVRRRQRHSPQWSSSPDRAPSPRRGRRGEEEERRWRRRRSWSRSRSRSLDRRYRD